MTKNLVKLLLLSTTALSLAACGNLSKISADGTTDNPVFPNPSDAQFSAKGKYPGSWVQKEDVALITVGMTKDQVYSILGRPHFAEGFFDVREWDYVLNYQENGEHKVCQYKLLFNKDMLVSQQLWKPADCSLRADLAAPSNNKN
ncbi:outer membrane protein assembly factor BamE [Pelistega europaea]|uniref:Outer membrane protein assembly factor BamE n=1 Tax=Pelistega europaea TaxID=106147 RepID=A0A7Y4L8X4_9BURK|nr:outer membrane protein assembly factor BamE [Pelistega europaea]NOL49145.1 outer membrane protein assembly factor BamE [Pelistega europaea]